MSATGEIRSRSIGGMVATAVNLEVAARRFVLFTMTEADGNTLSFSQPAHRSRREWPVEALALLDRHGSGEHLLQALNEDLSRP